MLGSSSKLISIIHRQTDCFARTDGLRRTKTTKPTKRALPARRPGRPHTHSVSRRMGPLTGGIARGATIRAKLKWLSSRWKRKKPAPDIVTIETRGSGGVAEVLGGVRTHTAAIYFLP